MNRDQAIRQDLERQWQLDFTDVDRKTKGNHGEMRLIGFENRGFGFCVWFEENGCHSAINAAALRSRICQRKKGHFPTDREEVWLTTILRLDGTLSPLPSPSPLCRPNKI